MHTNETVLSVIGIDPVKISASEIWFRELSEQLGSRGFQSVLCYLNPPPEQIRKFLQLPNVKLEVLKDSYQLKWQPTTGLHHLLRRYKPRIVHCHYTGFISPYAWLSKLHSAEKRFFTDQTSWPEGHVMRVAPLWKRAIVSIISYPLTRVQCVSNYGYECNVASRLLPRSRYTVIYNAVDICRASGGLQAAEAFRKKHSIPKQRAIVTQVSWIIREKGIQDLLQAASLVLSQKRDVQFVIVGDGPYRSECQKLAAQLGISEHLTWTGVVRDPLSEGVYAAADIVCQMSRWEEVFGQVIAEAMASWKPVIGTRVGGIPELIKDGETGFLVERGDIRAMADRILHLLNDSVRRTTMGNKGRQAAEARFDHRKNVSKLIELYRLPGPDLVTHESDPSVRGDPVFASIRRSS
jgi:glycosyltransferase involved in cell wall biosynthesis